MKIGCTSVVQIEGKLVAINCTKGRGYILPGGKVEKDETYKQTAARELKEETGLIAIHQRLVFHAPSGADSYYVYAFETEILRFEPIDSDEGVVCLVSWDQLLQSKFKNYYELLKDIIEHVQ